MFCFEHGDTSVNNAFITYATEFPREWGTTLYRTLYTGHWHTKKSMEYVTENEVSGFTIKRIPSLSRTDYYHYHNKFTGNRRAAVICIHHKTKGLVCEFIYSAK